MIATKEIKQSIRDSDPVESCRLVGKRLGINSSVVQYYRTKFLREAKQEAKAKNPKAIKSAESKALPGKNSPVELIPIYLVESHIDSWWKNLTAENKGEVFAAALTAGVIRFAQ
jgi:hypothetical protein